VRVISFWPHVWAIPLTFLIGVIAGWMLRKALKEE
jgi:hypothetical protein